MINKIKRKCTALQLHHLPGAADCHAATNVCVDRHAGLDIGKNSSWLLSEPLAAAFDDVVFSLHLQNLNLIRGYLCKSAKQDLLSTTTTVVQSSTGLGKWWPQVHLKCVFTISMCHVRFLLLQPCCQSSIDRPSASLHLFVIYHQRSRISWVS